jgi:hypothetical protein
VNARTEPVSPAAPSVTLKVQVPSTASSVSVASGSFGRQVPVNGSSAATTDANGRAAASSNTTWQRFSEFPPLRWKSTATLPAGEVSVPVRSPTQVWSMPTVVAPTFSVQTVPSIENVIADA